MADASSTGEPENHRTRRLEGNRFLSDTLPKLLEKIYASYHDRESAVLEFLQPDELRTKIEFKIGQDAVDNEQLEMIAEQVIRYSVKTGHIYFYNQLFNGVDPFALSGSIIKEALNCSAYTYELAPVFTLIEKEILNKFAVEIVGYPKESHDGIFSPGGSLANMYAMSLARYSLYPNTKQTGMHGIPPLQIFTSKLSHYSMKKGAFFLGIGTDNVIHVDTDPQGRMIPEALDNVIQASKAKGFQPLMVNVTCGTTVMGAFDPLDEISAVCKKHGNIWLHADACWGGAVLLSPKLRHKIKGVEKADSLSWDPHKMVGAIQQCTMFVTRHPGLLAKAHCANAQYLFQQDKVYDSSYDTGDKSVQCSRKVDAFKLWLQWKAYGTTGMAERIEACFANARYLRSKLEGMEGFRLLADAQECTNTCFWYIPPSMRGQEETPEWWDKLSKVAPAIKGRMQLTGSTMVQYQAQGEIVNFFTMLCSNPMSTTEDMDYVVRIIQEYGENL